MSAQIRRLTSPLVLALAAGAIAAPGAFASGDLRSPDARDAARAAQRPSPTIDLRSPDARDAARSVALGTVTDVRSPVVQVVRVVKPRGFDWGAAGIGAGIAAILGLGGAAGAAQRRRQPVAGRRMPTLHG